MNQTFGPLVAAASILASAVVIAAAYRTAPYDLHASGVIEVVKAAPMKHDISFGETINARIVNLARIEELNALNDRTGWR